MKKITLVRIMSVFAALSLLCAQGMTAFAEGGSAQQTDPAQTQQQGDPQQTQQQGDPQQTQQQGDPQQTQQGDPAQTQQQQADPAQTQQQGDPQQTQQQGDPAQTQQQGDPAQTQQQGDPSQQQQSDPAQVLPGDEIITAAVYLRLKDEVPSDIHSSFDAAGFGPRRNNHYPYFRIQINRSMLDRLLLADGKATSVVSGGKTYYSHLSTNTDNSTAFWQYVYRALVSDADRAQFSRTFGSGFAGYVLKLENDGWHIDGVMVETVYMTELYDLSPGSSTLFDMVTQNAGPVPYETVKQRMESRMTQADAVSIRWTDHESGVFYKADGQGYHFTVSPDDGTGVGADENVQYDHVTEKVRIACFTLSCDKTADPLLADPIENSVSRFRMTVKTASGAPAEHIDLNDRSETVTVEVDTVIPDRADVTSIRLTDTLVPAFRLVGGVSDVTVLAGGVPVADAVQLNGQTLTIDIPEQVIRQYRGESLYISFSVQIRPDVVLDGDYLLYDSEGKVMVPNQAEYSLETGLPDSGARRAPDDGEGVTNGFVFTSNIATVSPPDPGLEILVNGRATGSANPVVLNSRDSEVTYTVRTQIPERAGLTSFTVTDTLPDALELRGPAEVMIGGVRAAGMVQTLGQTLVITVPASYLKANMTKTLTVSFRVGIRSGVDLTSWIDAGRNGVLIGNQASYQLKEGEAPHRSAAAYIALPNAPQITETVDNNTELSLKEFRQVFTCSLKTRIPERAVMTSFLVKDIIAQELEYLGTPQVWIGGYPVDGIVTVSGQELTVSVGGQLLTQNKGKALEVRFDARVREDADVTPYLETGIRNRAWYQIDGEEPVRSNEVTVRPTGRPEDTRTRDLQSVDDPEITEEPLARVLGAMRTTDSAQVAGARRGQTGDTAADSLTFRFPLMLLCALTAIMLVPDKARCAVKQDREP